MSRDYIIRWTEEADSTYLKTIAFIFKKMDNKRGQSF